MSTDRGFHLYGRVTAAELNRAVQIALRRLTAGEWHLVIHPRCGTNVSVGMLLTAGFVIGAAAILPRGSIEQFVGLGVAAATAAHLTVPKTLRLHEVPISCYAFKFSKQSKPAKGFSLLNTQFE